MKLSQPQAMIEARHHVECIYTAIGIDPSLLQTSGDDGFCDRRYSLYCWATGSHKVRIFWAPVVTVNGGEMAVKEMDETLVEATDPIAIAKTFMALFNMIVVKFGLQASTDAIVTCRSGKADGEITLDQIRAAAA